MRRDLGNKNSSCRLAQAANPTKIKRYNRHMQQLSINERVRQSFERLLLEALTSPAHQEVLYKFEAHAGYLLRWRSVVPMSTRARSGCGLAACYLSALAGAALPLDSTAHLRLRQLGQCLVSWGRSVGDESSSSEAEQVLVQSLTALQTQGLIQSKPLDSAENSDFGLMVLKMLSAFETWSTQPGSSPQRLSDALLVLKGLAEQHQDQRIMELAWATANMLDRVIDGTLPMTEAFKGIVTRAAKLLLIAFVFQIWNAEDEWEYAHTIEDADVLASGGDVGLL